MESGNEAEMLFEYWKEQTGHPRSKLDDKRRRKLRTALRFFTLEECKRAIDGCVKSPWHMGENPRRKRYDQISLIFRDAEKTEMFMEYRDRPPRAGEYRDEVDELIASSKRGKQWN